MTRISPNITATLASQTAVTTAGKIGLGQFAKNIGNTFINHGNQLIQDHAALKSNALILCSLILVLSRIAVAFGSAKKAQKTPDGPYRWQEFIRTTIREIGGWTLSFVVLRSIEFAMRAGVRKIFKIKLPNKPGLIKDLGKQVASFVKRDSAQAAPVLRQAFTNYGHKATLVPDIARFEKFEGLINLFSSGKGHLSVVERFKRFYDWFPILVGSIPAIALSGYALERFSMDHSKEVVAKISQWRKQPNHNNQAVQAPEEALNTAFSGSGAASSFLTQQNRFQQYLNSVQGAQAQRELS